MCEELKWNKFPETCPPKEGPYLVIKKDKGHGIRIDRMRWHPFTPATLPGIRALTHGWGGNYGDSVKYWMPFPDIPEELYSEKNTRHEPEVKDD